MARAFRSQTVKLADRFVSIPISKRAGVEVVDAHVEVETAESETANISPNLKREAIR